MTTNPLYIGFWICGLSAQWDYETQYAAAYNLHAAGRKNITWDWLRACALRDSNLFLPYSPIHAA